MGGKSAPKPPDLGPSAAASVEIAQMNQQTAQEQLAWAREQDANNRQILERVLGVQLPIMREQYRNAKEDRARYEDVFRPLEDNLIQEFQEYDSPERRQFERGQAIADVSASFDAARRNALQRLESYGVDPSQTRNAALDIGVRTQQAAAQAAAGTAANQRVEDTARALRADAINIGKGLPSQVAASYGQSLAAGQAGVGGANQTFATGAGAMGNPAQWSGQAMQGYGQNANILSQGYGNQMAQYNANQQASAGMWQGIGGLAGAAMMMSDGRQVARKAIPRGRTFNGETGAIENGPSDGSGIDDQVPAMLSVGEFIIPSDVVAAKGKEFFEKLVDRYHVPARQQRRALAMGG